MRPSRFAERQIEEALKDVRDGASAVQICRRLGISETTFYRWRKQREVGGAVEVTELRKENQKLREIVANFLLDKVPLSR
ncbi:MAG: transposase [Gemmatimonadota bacterium]|nr:transposase [Gemmatimonadota bacterium]